jgi:hypothetical protein
MIGIVLTVSLLGGLIAGMIAYNKNRTNGTFVVFFILGAMFPLIGIIIAALSKGPQQGSWQPDPWGVAGLRWHDGSSWTGYTS